MPVTLYDGAIASLPPTCMVVAASSINLIGTMRALNLTNLGSGWVVSTPANGGPYNAARGHDGAGSGVSRRERTASWFSIPGYAPSVGEQIAVSYRTVGRAVGRAVNAASQQALAQAGSPQVVAWIGSVTSPRCAQLAGLPQCGADDGAGCGRRERAVERDLQREPDKLCQRCVAGRCTALNAPSTNLNAQVVVRAVKVSYGRVIPTWWSMQSRLPTTGPTTWPSRPARRCLRIRGCRR